MRRKLLGSTMALGLVVTAMGFSGIYAVFTDRATTGTNSAESDALQGTADLQIGTADNGNCTGATYVEDLATGVISASGLIPGGDPSSVLFICLKNVGIAPLAITASTFEVTETEVDCSGDEAAFDLTCGTLEVGDGELGSILNGQLMRFDCSTGDGPTNGGYQSIESLVVTPLSLGSIDPGAIACVRSLAYIPAIGGDFTPEEAQAGQTDKVEWRYAFDGTVS